ncbi:MAG: PPC domain-containing DNA-binding protein [Halanaerobiales bacterium]
MEYGKFKDKYVLRLEKGEEIVSTIKKFCEEKGVKLARVSGIGAVDRAEIGLFDTKNKEYHSKELRGDHEITSLNGNISTKDGETYLHLHINLSDEEYNTKGGHLSSAVISGTGEIVIDIIDGTIEREFNEEVGLNLFKFI